MFHLKLFTLISVRRNESFPHRVHDRASNPDHPTPLCVWHITGEEVGSFEFPIEAKPTTKCKELRQKQPKTQMYFLKVVIFQV